MSSYSETPYQTAIDAIEALPIEDRREVIELLRLRMAEERREQIAANAAETLHAVREKKSEFGTLQDLRKDLLRSDV
ncbi:conserved hypothetical protein [Desulfonatronospira thiodismutans ASO3-1]|uniref:Uncharacterized protein n=1 Tax=Desulfonatronospira thiodismutans ASO3-1 TaxID=555779 RepID=D6SK89_9BACT|nr:MULTISPECIES: hypothetical protein [Desulfonatronospira]EFI36292.1 conserved hypothetical protein [Desulfonatronospira thiodismutans ASO3-1]RQD75481.1 MAG: hypothetical protein D5S03_08375 [Desulfonatronospira sp. MSAO_Bac3]